MDKIRLNKLICDSGYCSRRQADIYIEQGRVTVNNVDCLQQGMMVLPTDEVRVDGESVSRKTKKIYIAFNKPQGVTCTTDQTDKTNIVDFVGHKERIFPIGRLDKQSQGLIFMTNDGDIVNKILRGGNAHQKEYVVTVDKPITDDFLQKMSSGVRLDRQTKTLPCRVVRGSSPDQFRVTLTQGINRQIRRMCEVLHYNVRKLQRIRIMNITLSGLPEGSWRYFTDAEIKEINALLENSIGTKEASVIPRSKPTEPKEDKPTLGKAKPDGKTAAPKSRFRTEGRAPLPTRGSTYTQYRKKPGSHKK